jgi:hypothetical protein
MLVMQGRLAARAVVVVVVPIPSRPCQACSHPPRRACGRRPRRVRGRGRARAHRPFTVVLSVAISPSTWISILRVKSPRATAVVTVAIDRTWSVKLEHIRLTWANRQALKKYKGVKVCQGD